MTREPNREVLNKWFADRGDITHRVNYDLDSNSTVLDVGGYMGDWAAKINNRYGSTIHIFEPVNKFYNTITDRFKAVSNITVHKFGLSDDNIETKISIGADASSVFKAQGNTETIQLRSLIEFMDENDITKVDLMKVNIEGGEYDLLENIIKHGYQNRFVNVQVQFHRFVDNCESRRSGIRKSLMDTHKITYDYPFVWENWVLKTDNND